MSLFFALLFRVIMLAFSFALSTLVAALFITFVLFLGGDAGWLQEDVTVIGDAVLFALAFWLQIAILGLAPVALVFLGLEIGRLSSLVVNLLAGGLCAAVILFTGLADSAGLQELPYEPNQMRLTLIAAGFVGGLVHWIVAGHRAGRWMGQQQPDEPSGSP